ncbi:hypothetical protein BRC72_03605 [Halobacteriales archaeon QH_7_66_36]|nr:MAG: hypothetical protein BRC72_03605 [Halobacteriales archaeon QH_7_66_36]
MVQTMRAEVIHVVPPEELDSYDLESDLRERADGRYVLVCREGGRPSWFERLVAFLRREPIEPVTLVAETDAEEGAEIDVAVTETGTPGVYEVVD